MLSKQFRVKRRYTNIERLHIQKYFIRKNVNLNINQVFSNSNNLINIFHYIVNTIKEIDNFGENKQHSFKDLTNIALTIDF